MRDLEKKIRDGSARIGVLGMGYVGLPLALEFSGKGFHVAGFDVDPGRVRALNAGQSHVPDVPASLLRQMLRGGRFRAHERFDAVTGCDVLIICVPTPLRKTKEPDVSYILSAAGEIAPRLGRGRLVVLESTTYPGTTRELVLPFFEKRGLKVGRDFFLAFSPERVDPSNPQFRVENTPKVVGGVDPASSRLAALLYGRIISRVVPVSSAETAEMVKLLENTFRAVNIGLVNEVALMCHRLGLDVWEVIGAAASKPFGFMPFYPGPGIGGHCIPLDPHYLAWKMKSLNFEPRFIELAGVINSSMPEHVVARLSDLLNQAGKAVRGSSILVLGAAYKPEVNDVRESPSLDVLKLLFERGARVGYHDPYVPQLMVEGRRLRSVPLSPARLRACDLVAILTAHRGVDYEAVVRHAPRVFDTRNATHGLRAPHLVRL